ncbi:RNI-like protein [Lentinus tigrinus ALCF2SS1-7]|uniref:RNI-like protein n=1 Tax=Lentinus tigrinus ALCF2SS1-7 TaxID=1328758 RepID=UPI001165F932|nr:RNI-like protein [Lentinus tigrinus ALCF2SS1-7]
MSQTHDIDNDVPFFLELDPYESLNGSHRLEGYVQEPQDLLSGLRSSSPTVMSPSPDPSLAGFYSDLAMSEGIVDGASSSFGTVESPSTPSKGKGVSHPMDIQRKESDVQIDVLPVAGSSSSTNFGLANAWAVQHSSFDPFDIPFTSYDDSACAAGPLSENVGEPSGFSGKGKGRERPPTLPPLVFLPTGFGYGSPAEWSSSDMSPQTAGPSSYGSGFTSIESAQSNHDVTSPITSEASAPLEHIPARRRSLSNLSIRSTRSLSALSITKVKVKLTSAKRSGNIARKLLFRKGRDSTPETPPTTPTRVVDSEVELGRGSCFLPWAPPLKSCTSPPVGTLVDIDVDLSGGVSTLAPLYGPPSGVAILRAKGRSYSSPFPLPLSPLDIVPIATADIFEPIPIDPTNYFDEYLPRELKLHIFAILVSLFEAEHLRILSTDRWTASLAGRSRNRWVGVQKGIRELLKLSRVSRSWQSLVYDGQLWGRLPRLPATILSRLCDTAGGFVQRLDFAGSTDIGPDALMEMTDGLCVDSTIPSGLTSTCLTTINLVGCIGLTTRSLHYLLVRSPMLRSLSVKGLSAVINSTCTILSTYCPNLVSLDMSRCHNLDGEGIRAMAATALDRGETLRLKVLRLNSLSQVTDDMMWCLGRAVPDLEMLDLSYAAPLHNTAIDAFISLSEEEAQNLDSVQLSARQAGRDPADSNRYWRRVTRLRHIALSSCFLLTDHACSHLAHAVPKLEFLELAGIGADLRDDGLVRLLETTPYIRRVDLEDASEISDAVLAALTPRMDESPASLRRGAPPPPPQPGHTLEHLVISSAADLTNDALLALIRNCARLRILEADGTRMNSAVLKEFVQLSRQRKMVNAYIAAIDCRGIGEHTVKDLTPHTRPRLGWRAWEARDLKYLDGRDEEDLGVGQDECDEMRVVLKTFYSWQTVDAVRAMREKKRKATRRYGNGSGSSESDNFAAARTRWWSPNGRRSGAASPALPAGVDGREGCAIM